MKKKSSRRTFLKSTLAMSAAGLTFPRSKEHQNPPQEKERPGRKVLVPVHIVADSLKNPDQWRDITTGAGTFQLLSIRQLYEKAVEDAEKNQGTPLLDQLIGGGMTEKEIRDRIFQMLGKYGWALYATCIMELIKLIMEYQKEEHRTRRQGQERSDLEDLKKAIKDDQWRWALRHPWSPYKWDSACPWGDCPA